MAEANAILRAVEQGYRSPVVLRSERVFDLEGHAVWEVELSVGKRMRSVR